MRETEEPTTIWTVLRSLTREETNIFSKKKEIGLLIRRMKRSLRSKRSRRKSIILSPLLLIDLRILNNTWKF